MAVLRIQANPKDKPKIQHAALNSINVLAEQIRNHQQKAERVRNINLMIGKSRILPNVNTVVLPSPRRGQSMPSDASIPSHQVRHRSKVAPRR